MPGFDIVLMGHDHARECKKVQNVAGDSVLVMDPASNGVVVSDIDLTVTLRNGKVVDKQINGVLTETGDYGISEDFMKYFAPQYATIQNSRIEEDRAFDGDNLPPVPLTSALLLSST